MRKRTFTQLITMGLGLSVATNLWAKPAPATSWRRIRTPHFDILFLANIGREANRVANTLEHLYKPVAKSLHIQPRKIPLILRNQRAMANGFVTSGPRRIEFFTFPPQDYNFLHVNDWLNLLVVHEFRHVVQYERMVENIAYIPPWFLEGDAVGIETALSSGGRGRIPHFGLLYKVNLLAYGGFSYQKQLLGSFKHPIPDHYRVGYYLTTYLRRQYGAEALSRILQKTTWYFWFPFAVKEVTGKRLSEIYEDANQDLLLQWQQQLAGLQLTAAQSLITSKQADYVDYLYPQVRGDGGIVALKSGIGTTTHFTLLRDSQKEQKLFTPGYIYQEAGFSLAQNKLVWVEYVPDPRWERRAYADIRLYDIATQRYTKLTKRGRYGAAALSPDATQLVAFESDESYNHQLVLLDAQDGSVLRRFANPHNYLYLTPRWSADGQYIVAIKHTSQGVTIELIDTATGTSQDILPPSSEHLGWPVMHGSYLFYNSAYSGIDNIYAIDLRTQQRYQVTSSKYGAYNPSVASDGQWLIFNDFTKDGMDVVKMPLEPSQWVPLAKVEDRSIHYYAPVVAQEQNPNLLAGVPKYTYTPEPYYPWQHLISLRDVQILPTFTDEKDLGLTASLWDLLGTATWRIGYLHNFPNNTDNFFIEFNYAGWYPVIQVGAGVIRQRKTPATHRKKLSVGVDLPLVFMHSQYTHRLSMGTSGTVYATSNRYGWIQSYEATLARSAQRNPRDRYNPWAQQLAACYQQALNKKPQAWFIKAAFFFPGLLSHHSLRLGEIYQYSTPTFPRDLQKLVLPRAYQGTPSREMYQTKVDYDFPISYPDWELGMLAYVNRIMANLFYDWAYEPHLRTTGEKHFHALGLGLKLNMYLFTLPTPLEVSISYAYRPINKEYSILFGVNTF